MATSGPPLERREGERDEDDVYSALSFVLRETRRGDASRGPTSRWKCEVKLAFVVRRNVSFVLIGALRLLPRASGLAFCPSRGPFVFLPGTRFGPIVVPTGRSRSHENDRIPGPRPPAGPSGRSRADRSFGFALKLRRFGFIYLSFAGEGFFFNFYSPSHAFASTLDIIILSKSRKKGYNVIKNYKLGFFVCTEIIINHRRTLKRWNFSVYVRRINIP